MGYDPTIGRWLEQDPAGYIDGPNRYQMEKSNPVNKLDPTGLDTHDASPGQLVGITNNTKEPIIVERDNGKGIEYLVLNPGDKTPANKDYDYVWYHGSWWKVRPDITKAAKDLVTGDYNLTNQACAYDPMHGWDVHLFTITNEQKWYNFDGKEHDYTPVQLVLEKTKQIFPVGPGTPNNIWYPGQKGETIPQSAIDAYQSAWIFNGGNLDDLNDEVNTLTAVTKLKN